jgi:nucleotide-binding universal stress UspA family protein
MGTIVVGVDGSCGSREALRFAVEEARLRNAALRVVTAWHVRPIAYSGGFPVAVDSREYEKSAEAVGVEALAALREETVGVDVVRLAKEGPAAQVLLQEARGADLLVVGSRGHGGFASLLLGSVSQQVAHHASCPVVIVTEPSATP